MASNFAAGRKALGLCDICGFRYKLKQLRNIVDNGTRTGIKACPECWSPDHPQNELGKFPVFDPQALRDPRSDAAERAASRALITPVRSLPTTAFVGRVTVTTS